MNITPVNYIAFNRNTGPGPARATRAPPKAGPTALAILKATPFKATAAGSSVAGTNLGTRACQRGTFIADPNPSAKVKASSSHSPVPPQNVKMLSPAAAAHIQPCVNKSIRLRSTMSTIAAAGRTTKNTGKLVAVCISATITGDRVNEVINQTPATFCIHVPILEAMDAIHNARKTEWLSGLQAEFDKGLTRSIVTPSESYELYNQVRFPNLEQNITEFHSLALDTRRGIKDAARLFSITRRLTIWSFEGVGH
jgi:hypothetical protein